MKNCKKYYTSQLQYESIFIEAYYNVAFRKLMLNNIDCCLKRAIFFVRVYIPEREENRRLVYIEGEEVGRLSGWATERLTGWNNSLTEDG